VLESGEYSALSRTHAVTLAIGANTLTRRALPEGDANDNNAVNITDFSLLAANFGQVGAG